MKFYRGYKGWRKIPFLFKLFHNPYEFGYVDWIRWKWLSSGLYQFGVKHFLTTARIEREMYPSNDGMKNA